MLCGITQVRSITQAQQILFLHPSSSFYPSFSFYKGNELCGYCAVIVRLLCGASSNFVGKGRRKEKAKKGRGRRKEEAEERKRRRKKEKEGKKEEEKKETANAASFGDNGLLKE